jgi:brefeldin A-resistance guanine nucleotide exchange factor 1
VLFPLITQLLKPEIYQSDPVGMAETRVRASTLLCKVFLHYLVMLSDWDGMLDLWIKIITIMDRLMNSGQGDSLVSTASSPYSLLPSLLQSAQADHLQIKKEEAVSESLKNILLVMSSGGYLAPPDQNPAQADLWDETWKRLNRFLPNFFAELFPEEAKKPAPTSPPKASVEEKAMEEGEAVGEGKEVD